MIEDKTYTLDEVIQMREMCYYNVSKRCNIYIALQFYDHGIYIELRKGKKNVLTSFQYSKEIRGINLPREDWILFEKD